MIVHPIAMLAVPLASVALADWMGTRRGFWHAGAAVLAILFRGLLANLGVLPKASDGNPTHGMVFAPVSPTAILLVLLKARLVALRDVGRPVLAPFGIGAPGNTLGICVGLSFAAWL